MSEFTKTKVRTCVKFAKAFSYSLPVKITQPIISFLSGYGKPTFSFKNTNMLRLESQKFLINAIGNTHILNVTIKKNASDQDVNNLEASLDSYIQSQTKVK